MELDNICKSAEKIKNNISKVIVGKESVTDFLLIALFTSGHVLLEDVPGMGKTLLAKTLSKSIDAGFKRIQFTPDLLPSDLTGIHFFNQKKAEFELRKGPVFTNVLLADEINRATPRTQSSLLECMEERQVTIDGERFTLEKPFFVIATQNPVETQGTFSLPEAQVDRFMIKIKMGYPTAAEEEEILKRFKSHDPFEDIGSVISKDEIVDIQSSYSKVYVDECIYQYIVNIVEKTRNNENIALGVSPRGSKALLKAAQLYALLKHRDYVTPDDVKSVIKPVICHRLILKNVYSSKYNAESIVDEILKQVDVPAENFEKSNSQ